MTHPDVSLSPALPYTGKGLFHIPGHTLSDYLGSIGDDKRRVAKISCRIQSKYLHMLFLQQLSDIADYSRGHSILP